MDGRISFYLNKVVNCLSSKAEELDDADLQLPQGFIYGLLQYTMQSLQKLARIGFLINIIGSFLIKNTIFSYPQIQ